MATLAAMLKRKGLDVRGSDQDVYPPMSDFLAAEGIPTLAGYQADHITGDLDLVIVGNAISRGNPSSKSARSQDSLLLAARSDSRAFPLGCAFDRHCRHARQDDDDRADWMAAHAGGRRSKRARRGIA